MSFSSNGQATSQNVLNPEPRSAEGKSSTSSAPSLDPEQLRRRAGAAKRLAASFGEIVAVLMRLPNYRSHALGDLEWLVLPAVVTGQFLVAEAQSKTTGLTAPVGLVLWASVDAETDRRLSKDIEAPIKLQPAEWKSGDIVWIVEAVGEPRIVEALLKQLTAKQWAGKQVKLRAKGKDGKAAVGILSAAPADDES